MVIRKISIQPLDGSPSVFDKLFIWIEQVVVVKLLPVLYFKTLRKTYFKFKILNLPNKYKLEYKTK